MKRKLFLIVVITFVISLFIFGVSYAMLRNSTNISWDLSVATWNVTLEPQNVDDQLTLVPESPPANYTINVKSLSEVDIKYTIVINNLPTGVEISLDGGDFFSLINNLPTGVEISLDDGNFVTQVNNTIIFHDVGTILYSDNSKTKSHTLSFRATQGTLPSSNSEVNIDVLVQQIL